MKRADCGATLLDLLLAVALFTIVLLTASNLMISFGKLSSNFVKNEASVMGTALGTFEDIVRKVTLANQLTIPATTVIPSPVPTEAPYNSLEIRIAPTGPATADHTNDTIHYYWQDGCQLKYKSKIGVAATTGDSIVAEDIVSFSVASPYPNQAEIGLTAKPANGPTETLKTLAVARARSAQ